MRILTYYELNIIKQSSSITNVNKKAASLSDLKELLHRPVRDLAWCILSPKIAHWQSTHEHLVLSDANTKQWLTALDRNPAPLYDFLESHNTERLGIYFELLLRFYFSYSPRFELKAHNLQLNRGKLTIGELDFVVLDTLTRTVWHIETAVKWYLYKPYCLTDGPPVDGESQSDKWCQWIGPNNKDCLAKKMASLINKQLKMSVTAEAKHELALLGVDKVTPSLWFKGYLFEAQTAVLNREGLAQEKAPKWLTLTQFMTMINEKQAVNAAILPKLFWLTEIMQDDYKQLTIRSLKEVLSELHIQWKIRQQAQLVALLDDNNQEYARYFIDYR